MANKLAVGETGFARVGLGTNRLTNTTGNQAFLREALSAGVTFIDTAHLYMGGDSELTIGAALAPFPEGASSLPRADTRPARGAPRSSVHRSRRACTVYAPMRSSSTTSIVSTPRRRWRQASR
jgi:hypothetical protein